MIGITANLPAESGAVSTSEVPTVSSGDRHPVLPQPFPDPLEGLNRVSYAITQPIDHLVLRPAAMVYKTVVPKPARDGARNAIGNLFEPVVFLNDLLQLHPKRALHTLARFVVNSAIGLGGAFDIAKREPFHLAHHNNGFSDTLGYYGIGPMFYVYMPIRGPTSLRDIVGEFGDSLAQPRLLHRISHPVSHSSIFRATLKFGKIGTVIAITDGLDRRAENDDELRAIRNDSVDPYAALRADYLQDRAGEVASLRANGTKAAPTTEFSDPLDDPAAQHSPPPSDKPAK